MRVSTSKATAVLFAILQSSQIERTSSFCIVGMIVEVWLLWSTCRLTSGSLAIVKDENSSVCSWVLNFPAAWRNPLTSCHRCFVLVLFC